MHGAEKVAMTPGLHGLGVTTFTDEGFADSQFSLGKGFNHVRVDARFHCLRELPCLEQPTHNEGEVFV
jgi:hypothetical protein